MVEDGPVEVTLPNGTTWSPQNFDNQSRGAMPVVDVLTYSRNQGTARLGLDVGLDKVAGTMNTLGVTRNIPLYPSILLGSLELTPFEVAMMYQPLSTGGFSTRLRSITDVLDKERNQVLSASRFTVSDAGILELEKKLSLLVDRALRSGGIDDKLGGELRDFVTHLLDGAEQQPNVNLT